MGVIEAAHHPPEVRSWATLWTRHEDEGDAWTLELRGEADIATLFILRHELAEGVRVNRARFVIDMAGLRFCDVASAALILSVSKTSPVILTGVSGSVKRVFDLLGPLGYAAPALSFAHGDRPRDRRLPAEAGTRRSG